MSEKLHLAAIDDGRGVDGITFSAQLGDRKVIGDISRNCLMRWALAPGEPDLGVFEREKSRIAEVVHTYMELRPGDAIRLNESDFA